MSRLGSIWVALSVALAVLAAGCTTGTSPSASYAVTRTTVNVTIQDWSVTPDKYSVLAGEVTFHVTNRGTEHPHEFVILKTKLPGDSLPRRPDGSADEAGEGVELKGKTEAVPIGESVDLTVSLDGGNYVVLCNLVEGGFAHYPVEKGVFFFVD